MLNNIPVLNKSISQTRDFMSLVIFLDFPSSSHVETKSPIEFVAKLVTLKLVPQIVNPSTGYRNREVCLGKRLPHDVISLFEGIAFRQPRLVALKTEAMESGRPFSTPCLLLRPTDRNICRLLISDSVGLSRGRINSRNERKAQPFRVSHHFHFQNCVLQRCDKQTKWPSTHPRRDIRFRGGCHTTRDRIHANIPRTAVRPWANMRL